MTDKLFKVGGVSKSKSGYKVRFANDMTRVKILAKTDTDINLVEFPQELDKPAVVSYLKTTDLYKNPEYRLAIDTADAKYNTISTKSSKVTATPSLEAIRARAEEKDAIE